MQTDKPHHRHRPYRGNANKPPITGTGGCLGTVQINHTSLAKAIIIGTVQINHTSQAQAIIGAMQINIHHRPRP